MSNGGVISISIPLSPYRCPPGPYERISLIASYIKKYKPASKLIVLDANQKIVSKGKLFKKAWDQMYSDIIEYRSDSRVVEVNPKKGILSTDFDDIICDVANLIPPQKAPKLLDKCGATDMWTEKEKQIICVQNCWLGSLLSSDARGSPLEDFGG